jgi:hypothetical protein
VVGVVAEVFLPHRVHERGFVSEFQTAVTQRQEHLLALFTGSLTGLASQTTDDVVLATRLPV